MEHDENQPPEQINVFFDAKKVVPKLVTKFGIAKSDAGNFVLSLIFDLPGEPASLVERIIIDGSTADRLIKALTKAKEDNRDVS